MFKCLPRHSLLRAILPMALSVSLPVLGYAAATNPSTDTSQPLQEVTVNAQRVLDEKTLSHAVSSFVESHAAAGLASTRLAAGTRRSVRSSPGCSRRPAIS